jgi:exopolysaccharide biosynthesis WecB/TagA/CpsF family protein
MEVDMQSCPTERDILGMQVKSFEWEDALTSLETALATSTGQRVVNFLNANNANIAHANEAYRGVLKTCELLPDGIGMDIASKVLYGAPFPANLNGTDFIPALLVHVDRPLRVALIGGSREVVAKAADNFTRLTPWHEFRAVSDGYFGTAGNERVLAALASYQPDLTLVAMGSPLQELWMNANIAPEHGRLVMGVGALFDFISGEVRRAPGWLREIRLEWLYRLLLEPGRLWRRYIIGNPLFLFRVWRYRMRGNATATPVAR